MNRLVHPAAPPWNIAEACRYAGCPGAEGELLRQLESCAREAEEHLSYAVCHTVLPVERADGTLRLGEWELGSDSLRRALRDCDSALVFAATVGAKFDRLLQKYSALAPAKALLLQGVGAERIESLCDAFCREQNEALARQGKSLRPRVSPGYGDIPLTLQRDLFALLDCPRQIGLTLNESLLMSPSKSVTAIAGIRQGTCPQGERTGCQTCGKTDCAFRKP